MKNKTLACWLAFLGGPLGLHRFYLYGMSDGLGWLLPIPTVLGLWGVQRMSAYGVDDPLSWVLLPILGFTIAACSFQAILLGLMSPEQWQKKQSRQSKGKDGPPAQPGKALASARVSAPSQPGETGWLTIIAVVLALLVGSACLMASIAFSFQHYFERQFEEARELSQ